MKMKYEICPICRVGDKLTPDFGHNYIFKSHSLLSMWLVLVEIRSASSEGIGRKKGDEDRIAV